MPRLIGIPYFILLLRDRLVRPSACPAQWVCRISLRRFSDNMHAPLHAPSDLSAISHFVFVTPLTDMRTPLHAPSDWSAVFHFVAPLIGVHAIYLFLLLT